MDQQAHSHSQCTELYRATASKNAVLIASGPSVTQSQVDNVKRWHEAGGGIVMVVNRAYESFGLNWADYLYTMDGKLLKKMGEEIRRNFKGVILTHRISSFKPDWIKVVKETVSGNSGSGAIECLCRDFQVKNLALLGCDAKWSDSGVKHHHKDYDPESGLSNCPNIHEFRGCFERAIKHYRGVNIINCSPDSALRSLPKLPIDKALESFNG